MKRRQLKRKPLRLDPGLIAVAAICLLAIWPFISRSALPQATDAELHIFRLAELGRLIREGEAFPRWAPNFYYGYGYPIFNYYAPLAYYAGLIPELMPFWDAVDAVKLVFIAGIFLGGVGVYGFAARNWGRMPALVASAAYVYAPFVVFVDPHARGDLAESLSFAIFPLAIWALDRLRSRPSALIWSLAVALIALLVLSHNLMALVFCAILAGWCLWVYLFADVPQPTPGLTKVVRSLLALRLVLAMSIGIGVAAFFWLTVALEQDAVNLGSLIGYGDNFDFRNHFLTVSELLSPARIMDWAATEPAYVLSLGSVQVILASIGAVALPLGRAQRKRQAAFFALVAAGLLFLMLPLSQFLWESVPYLPFLQFPWRLLGPAAFAMAILSATGVAAMMDGTSRRVRRLLPTLFVGLIMISALPLMQVPPWPDEFGPTTALRIVNEELAGRWLGTTSTSDFVPATVDMVPRPEGSLLEDFSAGLPLDRVNRHTLPDGTIVLSEEITPLHFRYTTESDSDFLLRLYLFEFPGWDVVIDGEPSRRELGRPEGFIVVPVEAGQHVVDVRFKDTPERQLAYLVSGLSVTAALVYAFLLRRNRDMLPAADYEAPASQSGNSTELLIVSLLAVVVTGFNAVLVQPQGWLRQDSPSLSALPAESDQYANFDGQIALIGYDAPSNAENGDVVSLTVYWQALRQLTSNYQVFVHLLDGEGHLVAQSDALNPGAYPTKNWPTDKYVRDSHTLVLPGELVPGTYRWSVGLWKAAEDIRLPVLDSTGREIGDSIILDQLLYVGE